MKTPENLKFIIYSEWSYDPPAGGVTLWYVAWGEDFEELDGPFDESTDHIGCSLYDEELEEFNEACEVVKNDLSQLPEFWWDNGGLGCGCDEYGCGPENAVKTASDFFRKHFDETVEEECDYDDEKIASVYKIFEDAENNPDDYELVLKMFTTVADYCETHNDRMF